MLFMNEGPFAQRMGIAPSVLAWVAEVRFPKVVDRAPEEAGDDVEGIDGLRAALGMNIVSGGVGGQGGVHPPEIFVHLGAALVKMHNGRLGSLRFDLQGRLLEPGVVFGRILANVPSVIGHSIRSPNSSQVRAEVRSGWFLR